MMQPVGMERVAIAGASVHDAAVTQLESLRRPTEDGGASLLCEMADELAASELVVIDTCNRVEVVYARESGMLPRREDLALVARLLDRGAGGGSVLRLHRGRDACRHLFRVAASLDSMVVGETEIVAQMRASLVRSQVIGLTGPLLEPLFECAFKTSKRVRAGTPLARAPVSVVASGVAVFRKSIALAKPRLAVVGAGVTGRLAAQKLREAGLAPALIVNRSLPRAREVAAEVGARALTLEAFRAEPEPLDGLVAATGASEPVLSRAELLALAERTPGGGPLVCLDLGLPRDLDVPACDAVHCIDIEALRSAEEVRRAQQSAAIAASERIIEAELDRAAEAQLERRLAVTLGDVLADSREVLEHEIAQLPHGRLRGLADDDLRAVERWARTVFGRLAHLPLSACKRMAHDVPVAFEPEEETTG